MSSTVAEIGALEAENCLPTLLDRVQAGEEFVITRQGKPVARLVRVKPELDPARAREAAAALVKATRGWSLGGLSLAKLRAEGRR